MGDIDVQDNRKAGYMPKFQVTQQQYDEASLEERERYNYVVVDDEPLDSSFINIPKYLPE